MRRRWCQRGVGILGVLRSESISAQICCHGTRGGGRWHQARHFAYMAYRAYRVMNTVGVVRMLNAQGQQVQVGFKTDAQSVATARRRTNGCCAHRSSQVVGSVSANYFHERARVIDASDDVQICSDAHKSQLQRQTHDVCDREVMATVHAGSEHRDKIWPTVQRFGVSTKRSTVSIYGSGFVMSASGDLVTRIETESGPRTMRPSIRQRIDSAPASKINECTQQGF